MYITWADVVNRYRQAADKIDANEAAGYIDGAEAEVNAACASRYLVPFTAPIPGVVIDVCIDLVYWKVIGMFNEKVGPVIKQYIDDRLKAIGSGALLIVDATGTPLDSGIPFASLADRPDLVDHFHFPIPALDVDADPGDIDGN